jgi:hypothetical protein
MMGAERVRAQLRALGLSLLGAWLVLFALSLTESQGLLGPTGKPVETLFPWFVLRGHVWFPAWSFHSMDFLHVFASVQTWVRGGDPYAAILGDPIAGNYSWPPIVLPLFAWCRFFPFYPVHVSGWVRPILFVAPAAVATYTLVLGAIAIGAGFAANRQREQLGLAPLPWALVCGLFVWSTPVLFAMERGNLDLLVLLAVLTAAACLRRRTLAGDLAAGALLAVGTWIKLYPALLLFGLLFLRRWRTLVAYLGAVLLIPLVQLHAVFRWLEENGILGALTGIGPKVGIGAAVGPINVYSHPLFNLWIGAWAGGPLAVLERVPARLVALGFVVPAILFVGRRVGRSVHRDALTLPLLLWVVAVATFVPNVSFDYNLAPLPLAVLCLADRRDRWELALLALLLPWWQPFDLRTGPTSAFCWDIALSVGKVGGVAAVGALLVRRAAYPAPPPVRSVAAAGPAT